MATETAERHQHGRQTLDEMLATDERWDRGERPPAETQHEAEPAPKAPSRKERVAFVLALVAIPASLIPILGVILASVAMDRGIKAKREADDGQPTGRATVAIALAAVAALLSIGFFVLGLSKG